MAKKSNEVIVIQETPPSQIDAPPIEETSPQFKIYPVTMAGGTYEGLLLIVPSNSPTYEELDNSIGNPAQAITIHGEQRDTARLIGVEDLDVSFTINNKKSEDNNND